MGEYREDVNGEESTTKQNYEGFTKIDKSFNIGSRDGTFHVGAKIVSHPLSYVAGSQSGSKMDMFLQSQLNVRVKRLEATMTNGELICETGTFQASMGRISLDRIRLSGKEIANSFFSKTSGGEDETFFKQRIKGTGKVLLKDTTEYLQVLELGRPTKVTFEKGSFYAAIGDFEVGITTDMSASNVLLSNRNKILPNINGKGYVVLESPVNTDELVNIRVTPDNPAMVDDDCVIARVGDVKSVERLSGGIMSSMLNKTGLVTRYTGNGYLIIAPSLGLYNVEEDVKG